MFSFVLVFEVQYSHERFSSVEKTGLINNQPIFQISATAPKNNCKFTGSGMATQQYIHEELTLNYVSNRYWIPFHRGSK